MLSFEIGKQLDKIYILGLEKNKLFIKNLSRDTTKEHLEKLFSQYGELKEVRLITFRNGHSKGLAYVEFLDEASAAKGLVKLDETGLQNIEKFQSSKPIIIFGKI